jgi:adenosine deaminase
LIPGQSNDDVRVLRRQIEERMLSQGYSQEETDILLHIQPYKADQLLKLLTVFDNVQKVVAEYLADVIFPRLTKMNVPRDDRLEMAKQMIPDVRKEFIKLFSADEAPALKAQMPLSSRLSFLAQEKEDVWFG